jgi:hypothetical protein
LEAVLQLLARIEARFMALRRQPADVAAALAEAVGCAGGGEPALAAAGQAMALAAQQPLLAYHNHHHVAEAVLAMGWLCAAARGLGLLEHRLAVLGVVAMAGHDLGHDGSPASGGRLEAQAAAAADRVSAAACVAAPDRAVLCAVILGTDPGQVAGNAARAGGQAPPGPLGPQVDRLRALANEADVLASLLPELGWDLADALAMEQGGQVSPSPSSCTGRLAFLRRYACFSPAATRLAMPSLQARMVSAFAVDGGAPEAGARMLDGMERTAARRRWRAALALA